MIRRMRLFYILQLEIAGPMRESANEKRQWLK